jgi:hypothetical protein
LITSTSDDERIDVGGSRRRFLTAAATPEGQPGGLTFANRPRASAAMVDPRRAHRKQAALLEEILMVGRPGRAFATPVERLPTFVARGEAATFAGLKSGAADAVRGS